MQLMKILIILGSDCYNHPPVMMGKIVAGAVSSSVDALVVVPKDGHLDDAQAIAAQASLDMGEIQPRILIEEGDASQVIKKVLTTEIYQLVIVNAERILRLTKTVDVDPLLIKQSEISLLISKKPKPKIDRILLCTACKENDHQLIRQAAMLAASLEAEVTMLHVFAGAVPTMYAGLDQIDETVEELLQTDTAYAQHLRKGVEILTENQVKSEVKIRRGMPIEEIVRETQIENYDLAVIGTSDFRLGLKEMLMGNLTNKIIDRVELPVLVVGSRELEP
jgi:nucleotide-binding universal stress UspA family protein